jgi:glutamine synthetase
MTNRSREEGKEYVLKIAKEHDVKFIRMWFTDILGFLKSFAITVEELTGALEEGMGFDGSSIEGFARIDESDMIALPDPDTFQLLYPGDHGSIMPSLECSATFSDRVASPSKVTPGMS